MLRTLCARAARFVLPAALALGAGCAQTADRSATAGARPIVQLAMVTSGTDDDAFGRSAAAVLVPIKARTGADYTVVQTGNADGHDALLKTVLTDYDEIFAIGPEFAPAIARTARDFPKRWFAIVGAEVNEPNVSSATFRETDGAWLAGAYAGIRTEKNVVAIAAPPGTQDLIAAFRRGVAQANPHAAVRTGAAGDAAQLAAAGADVVFVADSTAELGANPPHATLIGVGYGDAPAAPPWSARVTFLPGPAVTRIAEEVVSRKPRSGTLELGARDGAVVLRLASGERPYAARAAKLVPELSTGISP